MIDFFPSFFSLKGNCNDMPESVNICCVLGDCYMCDEWKRIKRYRHDRWLCKDCIVVYTKIVS